MTIDDLTQTAFDGNFLMLRPEADTFCQQEQITPDVFLDSFARHLVIGYMEDRFTWEACDTGLNCLMALMSKYCLFPDYAFGAFLAFDAGEYHPNTEDLTPDEVTRPLIRSLIEKYPAS